jgi:hypothetical protein
MEEGQEEQKGGGARPLGRYKLSIDLPRKLRHHIELNVRLLYHTSLSRPFTLVCIGVVALLLRCCCCCWM